MRPAGARGSGDADRIARRSRPYRRSPYCDDCRCASSTPPAARCRRRDARRTASAPHGATRSPDRRCRSGLDDRAGNGSLPREVGGESRAAGQVDDRIECGRHSHGDRQGRAAAVVDLARHRRSAHSVNCVRRTADHLDDHGARHRLSDRRQAAARRRVPRCLPGRTSNRAATREWPARSRCRRSSRPRHARQRPLKPIDNWHAAVVVNAQTIRGSVPFSYRRRDACRHPEPRAPPTSRWRPVATPVCAAMSVSIWCSRTPTPHSSKSTRD